MSDFYTQHLGLDGSTGGSSSGSSAPVVLYDDTTAYEDPLVIGTLSGTLGSTNSTLIVVPGDDFPDDGIVAGDLIKIDTEVMLVTGYTPATQTIGVTRGQWGSVAGTRTATTEILLDRFGRGRTPVQADYTAFGNMGLGPSEERSWWYPLGRALTEADANKFLRIISKGMELQTGLVADTFEIPVKALQLIGDYPHRVLNSISNGVIVRSGVENLAPFLTTSQADNRAHTVEFFDGGAGVFRTGMVGRRVITDTDRYSPSKIGDLQSQITAGGTVLTLALEATQTISIGDHLAIGSASSAEYMRVTAIMSGQRIFTVERGARGTTAATAAVGADVFLEGPLVGEIGTWMIGIFRDRQQGRWSDNVVTRVQTRIELA